MYYMYSNHHLVCSCIFLYGFHSQGDGNVPLYAHMYRLQGLEPTPSHRFLLHQTQTYGRVEIFYDGQWGTICDDHWDVNDGTVVCRMLGYTRATSVAGYAQYGRGTGPIHLDDVDCDGYESSIRQCNKRRWGESNCSHGEDASVRCAGF